MPSVPSVGVSYCSHVRWSFEYLCVGAAVMLHALYIVYYVYCPVSFNEVYLLFCLGTAQCFCIRVCFGCIKTPIVYYCACIQILYTSMTDVVDR